MSSPSWAMRRDRPPALHLDSSDSLQRNPPQSLVDDPVSPSILAPPPPLTDSERAPSEGSVASSSLDPYYFSVPEPASTTPDPTLERAPITPAKDPASINRRGLVGVGELTTPRWASRESINHPWKSGTPIDSIDEPDKSADVDGEESGPSNP